MDWPEIIAEGFPGPRDGEPPNLRGDIVDELNDHLACAMQRELRRTDDPAAAEQAVLNRFGDPKRIARRLWWDAMKEQIMKDRVMIGMMILTLLICAAVGFFAWQMMQQGQQVNQAILARLETLGKPAAQPEVAADWAKVTFRCYQGSGQGKPAANLAIILEGNAFEDANKDRFQQTTDAEGLTTFGPIRPGRYNWQIDLPDYLREKGFLTLYPGRVDEQVIHIPSPEMQAEISLKTNLPEDLKQKKVLLFASFVSEPHSPGSTAWSAQPWSAVLASDGSLRTGYEFNNVLWPQPLPPSSPFVPREPNQTRPALFAREDQPVESVDRLRHPEVNYRLASLYVMCAATDSKQPSLKWVECARLDYDEKTQAPVFEAQSGRLNTWTIDLPEVLLQQAREGLARETEPVDMLTDIRLRVAWPTDLVDKGLAVFCQFVPDESAPEKCSANEWWLINSWQTLVLGDGNTVWGYFAHAIGIPPRRQPVSLLYPRPVPTPSPTIPPNQGSRIRPPEPDDRELKEQSVFRRPATTYRLVGIDVMNPVNHPGMPNAKWGSIASKNFSNRIEAPAFVAEKDKLNTWTITLPDDLPSQIREYLAKPPEIQVPASGPAESGPRPRAPVRRESDIRRDRGRS